MCVIRAVESTDLVVLLGEGGANGVEDDSLLSGVVVEEAVALGLLAVDEDAVDGNFKVARDAEVLLVHHTHPRRELLLD